MKADDAKRLKELERENALLKRIVAFTVREGSSSCESCERRAVGRGRALAPPPADFPPAYPARPQHQSYG